MSAFFYIPDSTFLHRCDPRVKIAGLIFFCIWAMIEKTVREMILILAVLLFLFLLGRVVPNLRRMAGLFILIGSMTFGLWLLSSRSEQKYGEWGYFVIYSGAASYAAGMSLRFLNMLLSGLLFLSITSIEDISGGLIVLGTPYPFAFAVSLSFRLVMIFMLNAYTIIEAQKVRGNDVTRGSIVKRIRAYAPLIVPLILSGVKKAEILTLALESKGFSPQNKIDLGGKYVLCLSDKICLCGMGGICAAAICLKFL